MHNVVASAGEGETGAAFYNGQEIMPLRQTLIELGHPQPATPLRTDNAFTAGFSAGTIKQRRSKAIDMRFYWLKDRQAQGQLNIYWRPGATNLADYPSKHHAPAHHRRMRTTYLHEPENPRPKLLPSFS